MLVPRKDEIDQEEDGIHREGNHMPVEVIGRSEDHDAHLREEREVKPEVVPAPLAELDAQREQRQDDPEIAVQRPSKNGQALPAVEEAEEAHADGVVGELLADDRIHGEIVGVIEERDIRPVVQIEVAIELVREGIEGDGRIGLNGLLPCRQELLPLRAGDRPPALGDPSIAG